jgi:hypothetical protein
MKQINRLPLAGAGMESTKTYKVGFADSFPQVRKSKWGHTTEGSGTPLPESVPKQGTKAHELSGL